MPAAAIPAAISAAVEIGAAVFAGKVALTVALLPAAFGVFAKHLIIAARTRAINRARDA